MISAEEISARRKVECTSEVAIFVEVQWSQVPSGQAKVKLTSRGATLLKSKVARLSPGGSGTLLLLGRVRCELGAPLIVALHEASRGSRLLASAPLPVMGGPLSKRGGHAVLELNGAAITTKASVAVHLHSVGVVDQAVKACGVSPSCMALEAEPHLRLKTCASSESLFSRDSDASTTSTASDVSSVSSTADPSRDASVVLLEWHCESRPQDYHLTSHSWLEMQLSDGTVWRLEFSNDRGFSEKIQCAPSSVDSVYNRRVTADFQVTVTATSFRQICYRAACRKRYSTVHFNCHHWALAVWNQVVRERSQHSTYPDQWKAAVASHVGLATFLEPACGQVTGADGKVRPNLATRLSQWLPSVA
jgi:hypothetical protein